MVKFIAQSILLTLVFFGGLPATATEGASPLTCKHDSNQEEVNACAFHDHQVADQALNATYRGVMATLSPPEQQRLRQAQRLWLKNLAPRCMAEAKASEGGSTWALEYYGCTRLETERRTKQLANWRAGR